MTPYSHSSPSGWGLHRLTGSPSGLALAAAALVAIVIGLQLKLHAFSGDLADDEASHYVSALAVHDYFVSGLGSSPIGFIRKFHSHYPLIGIGHWGPLYYGVVAAWMAVFSTSVTSVLALSAGLTAATALWIYHLAGGTAGRLPAFFVAAAFVLMPMIQVGTSELMLDIPVAFLCLAAAVAYARYVEGGLVRHSAAFALLAAAAMLVKGNGICLALVPPLSILFTGRFDLLRKLSFWLPVPLTGALTVPWYVFSYGLVAQGFRYKWGWGYLLVAMQGNARFLFDSVGPLILVAAAIGFAVAVTKGRARPISSVAAAVFVAVWIFQCIAPADIQERYLAPLLAPLMLLAADGVAVIADRLVSRLRTSRLIIASTLAALFPLSILPVAMAVPVKPPLGFMAAAETVWRSLPPQNRAVLVVSNGRGEAAAIAALAARDPNRPSLFAVRGSRLLGGGGYNNADYVPRYATWGEVVEAIDDYSIPLALFCPNLPGSAPWRHVDQMAEALSANPDHWRELFRVAGASPPVTLYAVRGSETKPEQTERLLRLSAPKAGN